MRSTDDEIAELRSDMLIELQVAARFGIGCIACFVAAFLALREGDPIGHVLGVLGVVFAWITRKHTREVLALRRAIREYRR